MRKINLEQNTPEWLEFRRSHIMASDVPIIMGVSPYKKPGKLWEEKVLGRGSFTNKAMQLGHDLEPKAREWISNKFHKNFQPVVYEGDVSWRGCSLDGYDEQSRLYVEIKHPNEKMCRLVCHDGTIPLEYMFQIQAQMEVMDLIHCDLVLPKPGWREKLDYNEDFEYEIVEISRDDTLIASYQDKLKAFYESMLNTDPVEALESLVTEKDDAQWEEAAKAWLEARETLNAAKEYEEICREAIKYLAGDDPCCQGSGIKALRYPVAGRVDYAKIPELRGVDLNPYRKSSSETWRIISI